MTGLASSFSRHDGITRAESTIEDGASLKDSRIEDVSVFFTLEE